MMDVERSAGAARSRSEAREQCFWWVGKLLFMIIACAACITLYLVGTFTSFNSGMFYVTGYGIMSVSYYVFTSVLAYLNRLRVDRLSKYGGEVSKEDPWKPSVTVHVVGYKEDPVYFLNCLLSVKDLQYSNIGAIILVIDGNEDDDWYMVDIANQVFGTEAQSIRLEDNPRLTEVGYEQLLAQLVSTPSGDPTTQVYIIAQPHQGKREALYTAYKISQFVGTEFFLNTDSDTVLHPHCLDEMMVVTRDHPEIAGVAGMLTIFNVSNWLSLLSASRYFMAFHVERAAQSFSGVVGCISGPLGLYRLVHVQPIMDEWVDQYFLGKKCTFGDDRHLTNLLLSRGHKVVYTHRSTASTETPIGYARFVAQQTRWSKSYWRELVLQFGWAFKHWHMVMEMVYNALFPLLICTTIFLVLWTRTWLSHGAIAIITVVLPFIRSLFAFLLLERNPLVFANVLYPFLYLTTLLPVKMFALLTINNTSWGTSSRKKIVSNYCPVFPVVVWQLGLLAALAWHFFDRPEL